MNNLVDGTRISKLRCVVQKSTDPLFFSLVDYRNNLFTSDDPDKIIEFYRGFDDRKQLIKWMRERPKGANTIHEVSGDKDIIVVITTADYNGKFAKECREVIFKGLHIIFVESGEGDFYFNYSHNCNLGIRKAMEFDPKWVVISNDDMIKNDEVEVLISSLLKINNKEVDYVLTQSSRYHSIEAFIGKPRTYYWKISKILGGKYKELAQIRKKFCGTNYSGIIHRSLSTKLLFKEIKRFINVGNFFIVSPYYLKKRHKELLDSTYINVMEDVELSLELVLDGRMMTIDYLIKDLIGSSLGNGLTRRIRSTAGIAYFNYKVENGIIRLNLT